MTPSVGAIQPIVSSISPATGPALGETAVQISGSGFTVSATVDFGNAAAVRVLYNSATSLTAVAPAGSGTVDVTVTTPAGTSPTVPADQFTSQGSTTVVTRVLLPGWNTLSVPFQIAISHRTRRQPPQPTLGSLMSDGGASLQVAYVYQNGQWQALNRFNEAQFLGQPMTGLYLNIGGRSPVTITLTAASSTQPASPLSVGLNQGWNLVGPAAPNGQENYQAFVAGSGAAEVVDPNGAGALSGDPAADTGDLVKDGYGYWVYAGSDGQSLAGGLFGPAAN